MSNETFAQCQCGSDGIHCVERIFRVPENVNCKVPEEAGGRNGVRLISGQGTR